MKIKKYQNRFRYYLGRKYPGIYLTSQEASCVTQLLKNMKYHDIGKILGKSPPTVNFYLRNVRIKLKCKNRAQLIEAIQQTDFVAYINKK